MKLGELQKGWDQCHKQHRYAMKLLEEVKHSHVTGFLKLDDGLWRKLEDFLNGRGEGYE